MQCRRERDEWKASALFDVGVHALDGDGPARLAVDGAVHLGEARDPDRLGVKAAEEVAHGGARLCEEQVLERLERGREALVLEGLHGLGPGQGDELHGREVLAELDVNAAELAHGLHEARRGAAVRLLVVVVALAVALGRVVPRLAEQGLVVHDAARDGPRDDGAALNGNDAVLDRRAELVRGDDGREGRDQGDDEALPPRLWAREAPPHEAHEVALQLGEARVDSGLAGERSGFGIWGRGRGTGGGGRRLPASGREGQ